MLENINNPKGGANMRQQSYLKIELARIDDGSLYYHNMKNYEKFQTFIAIDASINRNELHFHSSGHSYMFELDKWTVKMFPIF